MKAENILLLLIAGLILYEHSKQQSGIQWISCDDPKADPVMCAWMKQQQAGGM